MKSVEINVDISGSRDLCYIRIAAQDPLSDDAIAAILTELVNRIREGANNAEQTGTDSGTDPDNAASS